jgi:hypothetical protein
MSTNVLAVRETEVFAVLELPGIAAPPRTPEKKPHPVRLTVCGFVSYVVFFDCDA